VEILLALPFSSPGSGARSQAIFFEEVWNMKAIQTRWWTLALGGILVMGQACQRAEEPAPAANADAPGEAQTATAPAAQPPATPPAAAANSPASRPAAAPAAKPAELVSLAAGTPVKVRLAHALSTAANEAGDDFQATLEEPLMAGGRTVAPKGAVVEGKVVEADKGGRVQGVAHLAITLSHVHTPGGGEIELQSNTITVQADTSKAKDATKVAIGSGVGAAIGAIAGGGKGAAIGAATGAGAGTAVVLGTRGDAAEIGSETVLDFTLSSSVTVR
jgi:hypothetical protein